MFKNKIFIGILLIIIIVIASILIVINYSNRVDTIKDISLKEYQKYSSIGIIYDGDETEIFNYLIETLHGDDFEISVETENSVYYNGTSVTNVNLIKGMLNDCKEVSEILYIKETTDGDILNVTIDYTNTKNKRIILEYTYAGIVRKTFKEKGSIVAITNELKKEIYYAK